MGCRTISLNICPRLFFFIKAVKWSLFAVSSAHFSYLFFSGKAVDLKPEIMTESRHRCREHLHVYCCSRISVKQALTTFQNSGKLNYRSSIPFLTIFACFGLLLLFWFWFGCIFLFLFINNFPLFLFLSFTLALLFFFFLVSFYTRKENL